MTKNAFLAEDTIHYEKLGLKNNIEIWEDGLRTNGDKGTFEWWYFDAEYSNGYKIVVIFYTKNRFDVTGGPMPIATIDITLPNGSTINKIIFDKDKNNKICASSNICDVSICDSYIKYENGSYLIDFRCEEFQYSCTLKPTFPMWRPKTGHIYFGEEEKDYFAWLVAVPSGKCNGALTVDDNVINMSGTGYHDHNWGNCSMKDVIDNWYWCRTHINNYTIITFDIIAKKQYNYSKIPLILIGKDNVILEDNSHNVTFNRLCPILHPSTDKLVHNILSFDSTFKDGTSIEVKFERDHETANNNLLNTFGFSNIKIRILNYLKIIPTYLRTVGIVTLRIKDQNYQSTFEREGIWEQMYFSSK